MHSKNYHTYDIDPMIYQELKWFCFQYERKKSERNSCYTLNAVTFDGVRCENNHSDPTENRAFRALRLSKDIELIDRALELAADEPVRGFLKKNVTLKNMPYERLGNVPMGRQQFYEVRHKFFYILKTMKMG